MIRMTQLSAIALALGVAGLGCANWDNPTALAGLEPEAEFELNIAQVETFEEVEIHVHVTEAGAPLQMRRSQLEIERVGGGPAQIVEMKPEGATYAAHVMFFEPGEHHLHLMGMPERHRLMREMGEHEIVVRRLHQVIGPYWVELEASPAPVVEGTSAHLHVLVFELGADGVPSNPASGLELELAIHDTEGTESVLTVLEEEPGEYEAAHAFAGAGVYELHVEIEVGTVHEHGAFHFPVLTLERETAPDSGGHDHD